MILALKNWLTAVLAVSMLISAAERLIPAGAVRRVASLTGGLLLLVVLIQPLTHLRDRALSLDFQARRDEAEARQEELRAQSQTELAELIAEKTEAYILDKAGTLGISCRVEVATAEGEGGLPVPYRAELDCAPSEALSAYLEDELGIPKERQVFHGSG